MERSAFLQEREAEAVKRTRLQTTRSHLVRLLGSRAKAELPTDLVEVIQEQTDLATLEHWFDEGLSVDSLDGVRGLLSHTHPQP